MEDWFQSSQTLEEEKTSYAEEILTKDAYRWWDQEDSTRVHFDEPAYSWKYIKQLMYDEFVKNAAFQNQYYVKIETSTKLRRWIQTTTPSPKDVPKQTCGSKPKRVLSNTLMKQREVK